MKIGKLPKNLIGEDIVLQYDKFIQIHFSEKRQVLSSSPMNGGYRENLTDVFNFDEIPENGAECQMKADTYEEHMRIISSEIGLNSETVAGLSTAVQMKSAVYTEDEYNGTKVSVIATGGINVNGGRAGDKASWDERAGYDENHEPGTINIILAIDAHLSEGAMTKAVITATEGKTAAIQELLAPSHYSNGLATGSGTDGIIVIANPSSEIYLTDAGQHSKLGELIGATVTKAVKRTLYLQTGMCADSQHNIFARMNRFGITKQCVLEKLEQNQTKKEDFSACIDLIAEENEMVTYTSLYAHLLDQFNWGLLSEKEAENAADRLLELMDMCPADTEDMSDGYDRLVTKYRNGLMKKIRGYRTT